MTSERDTTDADLMAALAAGDMNALGELVRRHQGKAFALALRTLGREDLAEDVAQDVFLRVHGAAGRYRPEAKFTTWLYRITFNRCLEVMRQRRRRTARQAEAAPEAQAVNATPSARLEQADRARRVQQAVNALPQRQRLAVILHRYHELSHQEIGEVTGWSRTAVQSLMFRAYAALRDSLADMERE